MPPVKEYRPNAGLAANVAKYRALSQTSMEDLAKAVGCSKSTIYAKLTEKKLGNLKLSELRCIARAMRCTLPELLENVK